MSVKLDAKDKALLLRLDFHARDSLTQLGKHLGISKQAVDYKLRRLEKLKVIDNYTVLVNMPQLGYIFCRLLLTLKGHSENTINELNRYLQEDGHSFWILEMQGQYDYLIDSWQYSLDDFRRLWGKYTGIKIKAFGF